MRYTGPRNRIARREGIDLGLKTPGTKSHSRLLRKLSILPGQHGVKRRKKLSERGEQLREKQKLRFLFGINEKKLKSYFNEAKKRPGNTSIYLANFLEKRLDNIVYRLGFAPTRASARQLISHKHIKVNNKIVNIPSYQVKINDEITFANGKITQVDYIQKQLENKDIKIPFWLVRKGIIGKLTAEPNDDEIKSQVDLRLVVEYYSR